MSASAALVIHILLPIRIYESPSFLAEHFSAKASLPDPDSERQYAPTFSDARRGKYFSLRASVPHRRNTLFTRVFWTSINTATDASARDICSMARILIKNVPPDPPYRSGISLPIRPIAKVVLMTSASNSAASSLARHFGFIAVLPSSPAAFSSILSSSEKEVGGGMVGLFSAMIGI